MGLIFPTIPYKSQLDPDASEFRNDCGPCALAMILNAFGHNVTTTAVYRRTGEAGDGFISVSQLMRVGDSYEVPFDYFSGWTIDRLKQAVDEGHTAITLVHYGSWSQIDPGVSTQNTTFTGPHFVVIVGYDDKRIYVNDPLWTGARRLEGQHKAWTYKQFNKAWGSNHLDGNRDFSGIVCRLTLPTEAFGDSVTEQPIPPPPPPPEVDPVLGRRIRAWAAFSNLPIPELNNPAVVNAYAAAMGDWGLRVVPHQVTSSDTLGLIALKYWNDPLKWQVILEFNGLAVSDTIHDGDVLIIPEPLQQPVVIPPESIPQGGTSSGEGGPVPGVNIM